MKNNTLERVKLIVLIIFIPTSSRNGNNKALLAFADRFKDIQHRSRGDIKISFITHKEAQQVVIYPY